MGCPHQCSFCNQRTISSTEKPPTVKDVDNILKSACSHLKSPSTTEIAFFGGSFTAIDRSFMISLLECAKSYLDIYQLAGIRISTRPDCIDEDILRILGTYGVTSIELGAQSMSDKVLEMNKRGHSADNVRHASKLIKAYGFELGLQMMVGLYGSTEQDELFTCSEIIKIHPATVRIYPIAILESTTLAEYWKRGIYKLYPFQKVVELCAEMLTKFENANIKVIKLGLHASESVEQNMLAGFYHPAFRELCESEIYKHIIETAINGTPGEYYVYVDPSCISKALGQKKANTAYFLEKGIKINILGDKNIPAGKARITNVSEIT